MNECLACELADGRRFLPGGLIHSTDYWLVEHCTGPLGLGTLIVKPKRHVTAVGDLSDAEASELGLLLRRTSAVARDLIDADQVYNCLWSHAGGVPGHLHYVVQPVTREQAADADALGPDLQAAMFANGHAPEPAEVERMADLARHRFATG
jgi:diadenosine tetraphosphate (Ap4A) HIT family hydrolase